MKNLYVLLMISFTVTTNLFGQIYDIKEGSTQIDGELRPALHVTLEPEGKETSKAFRSYLKDNHNIKLSWLGWKSRDAEEVKWEKVTGNSQLINVHTQFKDAVGGAEFYIAVEIAEDSFMSFDSNPVEMDQLEQITVHFLSRFLPEYLNEQIDEVNDKISSLDSDLKKARRNYDNNEADIKENQKTIEELKQEIYELQQENISYKKTIDEKEELNKEQHSILFEKRSKLEKTKEKLLQQAEVK